MTAISCLLAGPVPGYVPLTSVTSEVPEENSANQRDWPLMQTGERREKTSGSPCGLRAVEYVRMSTEHQQYSTENQADKIREYAARRGIDIVRTYVDAGKSGLRMDGRDGLQQLIKDVESGTADFTIILVYDVSRWGRFQDADESAYYEYRCRRAGI